jgi:ATP-dependent Clp protease ATP-binding subunit ClpB
MSGLLNKAHQSGYHATAAELQYGVIPGLEEAVKRFLEGPELPRMLGDAVTPDHIAEVLASATGIPVQRLLQGERDKLLHMEDVLRERVVGQDKALTALSDAVRMSRAGLHSHQRPLGSFLLTGPSGVGKTQLAKAVSELLFDDEKSMTRIDMSEYGEKFMVIPPSTPPHHTHGHGASLARVWCGVSGRCSLAVTVCCLPCHVSG